jgi:hypothetical protein
MCEERRGEESLLDRVSDIDIDIDAYTTDNITYQSLHISKLHTTHLHSDTL